MNNLIQIDTYEIKNSRTEQKVPVVNGVHLHSIYNPYKEAESLVETNKEALEAKKEVLVLGLGFAYHVNELIDTMTKFHGDNFKIIIIEPNVQVYNDCVDLGLLKKKNILVYAGYTASELYADVDLVHFLLTKPTLIAHPPSFNLYQIYFKSFLTYEAPTDIFSSMNFITNTDVKNYLSQFNGASTLSESIKTVVHEKSRFSEMDFLATALFEMTKGAKPSSTFGNEE